MKGKDRVFAVAAPTDPEVLLPAYTYGLPETGGVKITNFLGTRQRAATAAEARDVPMRSIFSPLVLEKAVLAHAGKELWLPGADELVLPRTARMTSVEAFGTL